VQKAQAEDPNFPQEEWKLIHALPAMCYRNWKSSVSSVKVALYARVSTKDKGQEVENQLAQLREFCLRMNWEIVAEYVDHETGSIDDRAQFKLMFLHAHQGKFDVVLFWALDRLSREGALETLQHLGRLTSYGVAYRSFTEQYLDTCGVFKEAVIAIIATIAKQERIRMSERVKAGLQRARAEGKKLGRRPVDVDTAKVATLRRQGVSWRKISRQVGIPTATLRRALLEACQKPVFD
jgi:DNA invertase Pin-like site-specific DNA recombinase